MDPAPVEVKHDSVVDAKDIGTNTVASPAGESGNSPLAQEVEAAQKVEARGTVEASEMPAKIGNPDEGLRSLLRTPGFVFAGILVVVGAGYMIGEAVGISGQLRMLLSSSFVVFGFGLFILASANLAFDVALAMNGTFKVRIFAWLGWLALAVVGIGGAAVAIFMRRLAEGLSV